MSHDCLPLPLGDIIHCITSIHACKTSNHQGSNCIALVRNSFNSWYKIPGFQTLSIILLF